MLYECKSSTKEAEKKFSATLLVQGPLNTDNEIVIIPCVKINILVSVDSEVERRILSEIAQSGKTSRSEIARRTNLSNSSISRAISSLGAQNLIMQWDDYDALPTKGRPRKLVSVNPEIAWVAGIDLGVTNTRIVVCDLGGNVQATVKGLTLQENGAAIWTSTLAKLIEVVPSFGTRVHDQCCLAVPGAVAGNPPRVTNAPNLPGIENAEFIASANSSFPGSVTLDNDVNMALTAELLVGKAQGFESTAMVTIGTGLGTAISFHRNILRGKRGLVGEFGQLSFGPDNRKLEDSITTEGVLQLAHSINLEITSPADLLSLPASLAGPALYNFHSSLLTVLTALAVSSDPDIIIVGGGIGLKLNENLRGYSESIQKNLGSSPEIVTTDLGEYATAMGACIEGVATVWKRIEIPSEDSIDSLKSVAERIFSTLSKG